MPRKPFIIFPWQRSFLPDLKNYIEKITAGQSGNATVIFPNQRPIQYLYREFRKNKKCAVLPRVLTFSEVINLWNANLAQRPKYMANLLDQVGMLEKCVQEVAIDDHLLAEKFANMSTARFLPWGLKLADLFENIFITGREAENLHHLEHEVPDPGHALLAALSRIGGAYQNMLAHRNWTTPGHAQYQAIKNISKIPDALLPAENRSVLFAGFSGLNGAEEAILKTLYEQGALVCLHSDANLVSGEKVNWAAAEHAAWIGAWNARTVLADDGPFQEPEIKFFSGYDAHSQLLQLKEDIEAEEEGNSVIVLLQDGLLMPVMHALDKHRINVTMGYPISRLPIMQLLKCILSLHVNKTVAGFYWRDVLAILDHPYIKTLQAPKSEKTENAFNKILAGMDFSVRSGAKYVDIDNLFDIDNIFDKCRIEPDALLVDFLTQLKDILFTDAGQVTSLLDLANFIADFVNFFDNYGKHVWDSHLDMHLKNAEAIHRVLCDIVPILKTNELAERKLEPASILEIYAVLVAGQRIPFHTDDEDNLQIMGMLETRLLNFDRVFIVDATDDALPGSMPHDPLMPNSLRSELGLPDCKSREKTMLYNLHRLCSGAREVYFYWREGASSSNIVDGKKYRSRFIENLVWEKEKRLGEFLTPENGGLKVARAPVVLNRSEPRPIVVNDEILAKVKQIFARPITAYMLDTYLQCPLKFAMSFLLGLSAPNLVKEGEDVALVGDFVHEALKIHLEPYKGKNLDLDKLANKEALEASFQNAMAIKNIRLLPPHSFLYLKKTFFINIPEYLNTLSEDIGIFDLEHGIESVDLPKTGTSWNFGGRLDRIDIRNGALHILDYKTGGIPAIDSEIWRDNNFFSATAQMFKNPQDNFEALDKQLSALGERISSLQLPLYLAMLRSERKDNKIGNGIYVSLSEKGAETALFNDFADEETDQAIDNCEIAVGLLLNHIITAPAFSPRQSKSCDWCAYADICASA